VTLLEASRRLGGQVLLAQEVPGRAEFGGAVGNLEGEARRAGVRIELGTSADADVLAALEPDAVVLATGAVPRVADLDLVDDPVVLTAWDVLRGAETPRGRVVVVDWRCDWVGLGTALRLAEQGHRVTLGVSGYHAGQRLQQYVRDDMLAEAARRGVEILPLVRPYGADADTVYLQHVLTDEPVLVHDVAALVLALGHLPVDGLLRELEGTSAYEVHAVGDCLAPRTVEEAVLEGLRVGSLV
jgi:NADPH-dependent 2,4-dienoyl-CoA reductase/sulfur reductase-like enzyme